MPSDEYFLQLALDEAGKGNGLCYPNPKVGAVIVKNNKIIATGHHQGFGLAHAEVNALSMLGNQATGATLYVSLEPCCHIGKTPPCTEAIIQAGIQRVVYAMIDPARHNGKKGADVLKNANIACDYVPTANAVNFYQSYRYWLTSRKPFTMAKLAISQDYKIAGKEGTPAKITGETSLRFTHGMRQATDAILTTVKTIIADDPQFNARNANGVVSKKPLYVLDRLCRLPLHSNIFHTTKSLTVFYDHTLPGNCPLALQERNVRCIGVNVINNQLDTSEVLQHIGNDGVQDLWVEAGGRCFYSFASQGLLQRAYIIQSAVVLGDDAYAAFFPEKELQKMIDNDYAIWSPHHAAADVIFYKDW